MIAIIFLFTVILPIGLKPIALVVIGIIEIRL